MQERGQLIRSDLVREIRNLSGFLSEAMGYFGADLEVKGSDGIEQKNRVTLGEVLLQEDVSAPY
jgi:hypothetical protein